MKFRLSLAASALVCVSPSLAQEAAPAAAPIVAKPVGAAPVAGTFLPANTRVMLAMNEEITSKRVEEGHKFSLSVTHDVTLQGFVVIPRGTPAFGEVVWRTGKGAFGKSGKMEVELRYIDLNGRRIPITGKYRQEGEGNTVATVGAVVAVGVFGAFVTGKSARIPQGRELPAFTAEALPVSFEGAAPAPVAAIATAAAPTPVAAVATVAAPQPAPAEPVRSERDNYYEKLVASGMTEKKARKETDKKFGKGS
jgi:hypothetical protein